ncbi:golgin subfamily A member 4-like [Bolinopsis microptera]|uniref:golgin subfamily A member 4-like n=1 Tax=Bolinopsis microptera TaxID=2820187 RepID=UPI0030791002
MGQTISKEALSDNDSHLTNKKKEKVEERKLVKTSLESPESLSHSKPRGFQYIQDEESWCRPQQAKFSCEDQKILEPALPSLTKKEESKEQFQDEETKHCPPEERIEKLEQEMWNKDAENASLKSQITRLNETVAFEQRKHQPSTDNGQAHATPTSVETLTNNSGIAFESNSDVEVNAENASLKSQITRLNETVAEEQQKTCQEQWNLYYEQVKTQEEIEKSKLLQEELSKVKEELSNITARTTVASEMNPMDCSSESEDAENASLKSQITRLNETVAEEQQKTCQEQWNLHYEQVKTQEEIEKNRLLQEELSKVKEELSNITARTTIASEMNPMDCSSDSEATLVNFDARCVLIEQRKHQPSTNNGQAHATPTSVETLTNNSGIAFESDSDVEVNAENASLKTQITRLNETVAEEQQKTCQEQWNLYYEQVKTQEEIEKSKLLQEELSKVKEELSNITARTTVASEMNPMDCSSDSEATLVNFDARCLLIEQRKHQPSTANGQALATPTSVETNDSGIAFESDVEVPVLCENVGKDKTKFKLVNPESSSTITDNVDLEDKTSIALCKAENENKQLRNYINDLQLSYDEIRNYYFDLCERYQGVEHDRFCLVERVNGLIGESKEKFKAVDPESTIIDETDLQDDTSIVLCNCNADKENKQLRNYLQLSYDETKLRENQYLDLCERYKEVEHDRSRLVERANDLFKTNQEHEKEMTTLRDLNRRFKECLTEMQSEFSDVEDHNKKVFQNLNTENENLHKYKRLVESRSDVCAMDDQVNYKDVVQNLTNDYNNLNKQFFELQCSFHAMEVGNKETVQNLTVEKEKLTADNVELRSSFYAMEVNYREVVQNLTVEKEKQSADNDNLKKQVVKLRSSFSLKEEEYKFAVDTKTAENQSLIEEKVNLHKKLITFIKCQV